MDGGFVRKSEPRSDGRKILTVSSLAALRGRCFLVVAGITSVGETQTERKGEEQRRGSCQKTARPRRFASDALAIRESRA